MAAKDKPFLSAGAKAAPTPIEVPIEVPIKVLTL
jgi:hypothetical protein